jgi:hypothetical protein
MRHDIVITNLISGKIITQDIGKVIIEITLNPDYTLSSMRSQIWRNECD